MGTENSVELGLDETRIDNKKGNSEQGKNEQGNNAPSELLIGSFTFVVFLVFMTLWMYFTA